MALVFCGSCLDDVIEELKLDERRRLYRKLGLSLSTWFIFRPERSALQQWAEQNPRLVTKQFIISALRECNLLSAAERLIRRWNLQGIHVVLT